MLKVTTTQRRAPRGVASPRKGRPGMLRSHVEFWDPMSLKGKRVVVVGAGTSGVAAADFCLRRGARVVVSDRREPEELGVRGADLARWGARLAPGGHPWKVFKKADLVILSPGVPGTLPALARARAEGIPVLGEVELAARHLEDPLIAITGTNGKSTTTAFIGQLLRASSHRAFVGGNFGTPLIQAVDGDHDMVVAELSSFQLETAESLKPRVAVLLNISEDHLERYEGFEHYAQTKARIFKGQRPRDLAVVNAEDVVAMRMAEGATGRVHRFSSKGPVACGAWVEEGHIVVQTESTEARFDLASFGPPGLHNQENLMAAILTALSLGITPQEIQRTIPGLEGLSHRMEPVGTLRGARWFNDSKATNPASVIASCEGLAGGMVLLLGGKDKGGDLGGLRELLAKQVRHALLFGEARHRMAEAFEGACPLTVVETLGEASVVARDVSEPGDRVILSPACSSYDQFVDYRERGRTFRAITQTLISEERS